MADPTPVQLRAFVLAARKGSVSAAAVELDLTQSAVSHALRQLERTLGVQLLVRHGRGVTLSEAGRQVLPPAEQLLETLETLTSTAANVASVSGTVRIASFPSLARHLLPRALVDLGSTHPALSVRLDDAYLDRDAVIQAVRTGTADIGLTQLLPGMALVSRPMGEDPYELLAPHDWTLPALWTRPYIHLGDPRDLRVPDALARHGLTLRPSLSLSSETAIVAMVASGLGFALLPRMTVPELPPQVRRQVLPWPVTRSYGTVNRASPPLAVQVVLASIWAE